MTLPSEILIGNKGADHVSIVVTRRYSDPEGWLGAEIEVRCDGWFGRMRTDFMKGELARFADEIRKIHRDLVGTARLQPVEPNLVLTFVGDGKGHIAVDGVAQNHFVPHTKLDFQFTIDQTYLGDIARALSEIDPTT